MLTRKPMHLLNVRLFLLLILVLLVQSAAARPVGQSDKSPENLVVAPPRPDTPTSILFSYQGNLLDSNGNPISNAAMPMTFKLYTVATGGSACWTEDRTGANAVNVQTGHFQVLLGRVTTMNTACLAGDAYLELMVNGETLTPREQLASVAFTVEAQTVSNGAVTTAKIADGAVTTAKIQDGQVSSADIADNTVDETDIADSFKARDADKLDNLDSSAFAPATHNHDAFYYTKGESDSRFFNVSGDTVTGNLTVDGYMDVTNGDVYGIDNLRGTNEYIDAFDTTGSVAEGVRVGKMGVDSNYSNADSKLDQVGGNSLWVKDKIWAGGELWSDSSLSIYGNATIGPPNSGEGGEITLRAGDSGNSWTVDNNRGQFRLHHDGAVYFTVSSAGDVKSQSDLTAGRFLRLQGTDFIMEDYGGRGGGRAMVNDLNDTLTINYDNDFTGGIRLTGQVSCGGLVETNLQTKAEQENSRIDRFEQGDVLCWGVDQLERCTKADDRLVQAVASTLGKPIIIGAEKIKVLGPVQRGDILVASSIPGYAMVNNNPKPGSVIAQALEGYDGERGIIKAMIRKW